MGKSALAQLFLELRLNNYCQYRDSAEYLPFFVLFSVVFLELIEKLINVEKNNLSKVPSQNDFGSIKLLEETFGPVF